MRAERFQGPPDCLVAQGARIVTYSKMCRSCDHGRCGGCLTYEEEQKVEQPGDLWDLQGIVCTCLQDTLACVRTDVRLGQAMHVTICAALIPWCEAGVCMSSGVLPCSLSSKHAAACLFYS